MLKGMIDPDKYIFLLGGHDLEMEEIRNILQSYGLIYHDLNLEWGAKLSAYGYLFDNYHTFIGIELTRDIPPPQKYIEINHHNDKSDYPSSIEQIATLLDIELNHDQQLIAANDRGYIKAMVDFGASPEEIAQIRKEDRHAQGVTEKDERLADIAVKKGDIFGNIMVVYYEGNRFSPVTDLVQVDHLIVWNYRTLSYYGNHTAALIDYYKQLTIEGKAYYGGNPVSFFGLVRDCFKESEIIHNS